MKFETLTDSSWMIHLPRHAIDVRVERHAVQAIALTDYFVPLKSTTSLPASLS